LNLTKEVVTRNIVWRAMSVKKEIINDEPCAQVQLIGFRVAAQVPPDDTAPDDTAPDDTAPDDAAPDDAAQVPPSLGLLDSSKSLHIWYTKKKRYV
jgi:hypothetical protein